MILPGWASDGPKAERNGHELRQKEEGRVMTRRVLIVGGALEPERYRPFDHWRVLLGGTPSDVVDLVAGDETPSLDGFTHLILTGSEASIVEDQSWYVAEEEVVRDAVKRGLPILGSCFGAQMLVRAMSGREHVRRATAPEIGWHPIEILEEDVLLDEFPNPWWAFQIHSDEACPPPPWRVLARTQVCAAQVYRFGELPVWAIQAHPEIGPEEAATFLKAVDVPAGPFRRAIEDAKNQTPRDDGLAQTIVDRFLRI